MLAPSPIRMGPSRVAPAPSSTLLPTMGCLATPFTPETHILNHPQIAIKTKLQRVGSGTCPAEGDLVQHGDIVPDDGRLSDDHAGAVVDHEAEADLRSGMDVDVEHLVGATMQK